MSICTCVHVNIHEYITQMQNMFLILHHAIWDIICCCINFRQNVSVSSSLEGRMISCTALVTTNR
ncbi:rCG44715 [Rattus norvegicus]|uniref:RCG44715 n=1 Tax=Rattus norvegicus TaxID=10116 RepID=A6I5U4_RAT|nr:rCG44715 [Rattus norvegicus]